MAIELKFYFVTVNKQQTNMLDFYFTRQCKGRFKIVSLERANAFLVDMDQFGAKDELAILTEKYPDYPIVQLSLKETAGDNIFWVKKPITIPELKKVLDATENFEPKVTSEKSNAVEISEPIVEINDSNIQQPSSILVEESIKPPTVEKPEPIIDEPKIEPAPSPTVIADNSIIDDNEIAKDDFFATTNNDSDKQQEESENSLPAIKEEAPSTTKNEPTTVINEAIEKEDDEINFDDFNIDDIPNTDLFEEEIIISPMFGQIIEVPEGNKQKDNILNDKESLLTPSEQHNEDEKRREIQKVIDSEFPDINDSKLFEDVYKEANSTLAQTSKPSKDIYNLFNHGTPTKPPINTVPESAPIKKKTTPAANVSIVEFEPNDYLCSKIIDGFNESKDKKNIILLETSSGNILIDEQKSIATVEVNELRLRTLSSVPITQADVSLKKAANDYQAAKNTRPVAMKKEELIWKTALWASRGRIPIKTNLEKPIKLKLWSDSKLINNYPHAKKIAALWTQKPRSLISTIAVTGLPQRNIFNFYSAATALGLLDILDETENNNKNKNLINKIFRSR